jgi:hypothetical protein
MGTAESNLFGSDTRSEGNTQEMLPSGQLAATAGQTDTRTPALRQGFAVPSSLSADAVWLPCRILYAEGGERNPSTRM